MTRPNKYIYKKGNYYNIYKYIGKECYFYGKYKNIDEARQHRDFLVEHNWDIQYQIRPDKSMQYIRYLDGKYRIYKTINKTCHYYGTFNTIEEARAYRDFLIEHEWDIQYKKYTRGPQKSTHKYISHGKHDNKYHLSKTIHGVNTHFGSYNTLQEAVHERDFWISINWNIDLLDLY